MDDNGYCTHLAGTASAEGNNNTGVVGVSGFSKIMALKFLNSSCGGTTSDELECLDYVLDQKVNKNQNIVAVNASYGYYNWLFIYWKKFN